MHKKTTKELYAEYERLDKIESEKFREWIKDPQTEEEKECKHRIWSDALRESHDALREFRRSKLKTPKRYYFLLYTDNYKMIYGCPNCNRKPHYRPIYVGEVMYPLLYCGCGVTRFYEEITTITELINEWNDTWWRAEGGCKYGNKNKKYRREVQ